MYMSHVVNMNVLELQCVYNIRLIIMYSNGKDITLPIYAV